MNTQEITNFIASQLKLGTSRTEIEKILTLNRIDPKEIAVAFDLALATDPSLPRSDTAAAEPVLNVSPTPPTGGLGMKEFPPRPTPLNSVTPPTPATPPPPPRPITPPPTPPPVPPSPFSQTTTIPGPKVIRSESPFPLPPIQPGPEAPTPPSSKGWAVLFVFFLIIIAVVVGGSAFIFLQEPEWIQDTLERFNLSLPEPLEVSEEPILEPTTMLVNETPSTTTTNLSPETSTNSLATTSPLFETNSSTTPATPASTTTNQAEDLPSLFLSE